MIIIIVGTKRNNLKDCLDRDNKWLHWGEIINSSLSICLIIKKKTNRSEKQEIKLWYVNYYKEILTKQWTLDNKIQSMLSLRFL